MSKRSKKDLEKENAYLRLQLAVINKKIDEVVKGLVYERDEAVKKMGAISYLSDSSTIDENLQFVFEYEKPYYFFHPEEDGVMQSD